MSAEETTTAKSSLLTETKVVVFFVMEIIGGCAFNKGLFINIFRIIQGFKF